MFEIKRLEIDKQNDHVFQTYHSLTPEAMQCCLRGIDPEDLSNTIIIGIGAVAHGEPIGIALGSYHKILKQLFVRHLYVKPAFRNQHIGRQLLDTLKNEAKLNKCRLFTFIFEQESPTAPALDKVLSATHWKGVRPIIIRCLYDVHVFDMPWIHINYRYPKGFEEFPWSELTDKERNFLLKEVKRQAISYTVSPFYDEARIEPINSLGLRYQGKVVGWMITHRTAPDTVVYTSLYVDKAFHFSGIAMKLLFDSIKLHLQHPSRWAILDIPLLHIDSSWLKFAERRLVPFADQVTHLLQAWSDE